VPYAVKKQHPALAAVVRNERNRATDQIPSTSQKRLKGAHFVAADEFAVPALGLSKSPAQTPPASHFYGLVSHLVYAARLETVCRSVRNIP